MAYNMSDFTGAYNLLDMYGAINTASGNVFAYMTVFGVFIIVLFSVLKNNPPAESFAAASTVTTVFCLLFLMADLISVEWVIGSTLIMAGSVVKLYFT